MKRFALFLTCAICFCACAAANDFPSLEPTFVFESEEEDFSSREIFRAALLFSESPAVDVTPWLSKYDELEAHVTSDAFLSLPELERAESVLDFLYERVLKNYQLKQTKLTVALDRGTYNCVSSSVLYLCLAKASGLEVVGNRAPDHSFISVNIDGRWIDVETTNPMGFNPGMRRQISSGAAGTKYAVVPKRQYSGRHRISDRMLVSLVANNLVSVLMDAGRFDDAVPLAVSRMMFLSGEEEGGVDDGRLNFDIVCSNYAAALQRKKLYVDSMDWMDLVVARWGLSPGLHGNYEDASFNGILSLCNSGKSSEALKSYEERKSSLSAENRLEIENMIFLAETKESVESLDEESGLAYLLERLTMPEASNPQIKKQLEGLVENYWIRKCAAMNNEEKFLEAASLAQEGLNQLPSSRKLIRIKQQSLSNYAAWVHNRFADAANKGRYEEAREILKEGLGNVPENAALKNDMVRLNRLSR